ncbi:LacI family DNA-binding transcriptional regulator [Sinomonas sp. ASV486]|uniref:LacI family DNA-binding transcriptional regulator n=1 Tax=Sinomonas sp. ASV486 TaxID=3051170 RepID=UPI0027DE2A49|nr:LacI family DNA-binding transcriptional regulator [Sinomonas sp. ASV486]MDQ4491954.1 LacI family DNA-binding transcriptional regulator [Sinomonas sp. ASV486]
MAKRPTMADVAAEAGVSRALVSIVFRGTPGASDATRARVLAAADRLGYRLDTRARLLRSARSRLLGVVFALDGAFHAELVEALYPAASAAGFDLALSARSPRRSEDEALRSLLDLGVEALLVLAPNTAPDQLGALPLPVVSVLEPQTHDGVASVATDEAAGVGLAVAHLRGLGHRRLVHIDGGSAVGAEARRGAFRVLEGEDAAVVPGGPNDAAGMDAARTLLALVSIRPHEAPTAAVVFNDEAALGVVHVLRAAGLRVPEDLSVVGYDDSRLAALVHVSLTSVRQDPDALAAASVHAAAEALEGRIEHALVPPSLTVRSSTAPPRAVVH